MSYGVQVFRSLQDALKRGYQVYELTPTGYKVRIRENNGPWAFAFVEERA